MSWLARIEEACAAFIERGFAKSFPSDLEAAQIARKLVAVMEARTDRVDERVIAPSRYGVYVNPADYERLGPHREYLQAEWAALLSDVASHVGMVFAEGGPVVELAAGNDVVLGAVEIETNAHMRETAPTAEPLRRFVLISVDAAPVEAVYPVKASTSVGRSTERDICLLDPSVSRDHAVIEVDAQGAVLRDCASTNGTFVNGARIQLQRLTPGDEVSFGTAKMWFREENPS